MTPHGWPGMETHGLSQHSAQSWPVGQATHREAMDSIVDTTTWNTLTAGGRWTFIHKEWYALVFLLHLYLRNTNQKTTSPWSKKKSKLTILRISFINRLFQLICVHFSSGLETFHRNRDLYYLYIVAHYKTGCFTHNWQYDVQIIIDRS